MKIPDNHLVQSLENVLDGADLNESSLQSLQSFKADAAGIANRTGW